LTRSCLISRVDYGGSYWLGTFAILALDGISIKRPPERPHFPTAACPPNESVDEIGIS
jgi:hypothetical protein